MFLTGYQEEILLLYIIQDPLGGQGPPGPQALPLVHRFTCFQQLFPKPKSSSDVFYSPVECEEKWQDFPINMTLTTQMWKPLRRNPGEFHTLW